MKTLDRLLRPKSIAVLGAGWALNVIEQCQKMGFKGPVWPVHPTKSEIGGLKAYPSLADLPEPPDATFIRVNRFATIVSAQASLLDVDHVVFGGPFWKYFESASLELLPTRLKKLSVTNDVHGLDVMGTAVTHDVGAVGAACLVLEDSFGPHAASLMLDAHEI